MYVYVYVYVYANVHVYVYAYVYSIHIYVDVHTYVYNILKCTCTYIPMFLTICRGVVGDPSRSSLRSAPGLVMCLLGSGRPFARPVLTEVL